MADEFSVRYGDLLTGSYDCVDRIVLNAYMSLCHSPGGFRIWWRRWHDDRDAELDNTHLMRLAGRFSRRVRARAKSNAVPVIDCPRDERKHEIAEEYLATHPVGVGVFLVLVARSSSGTRTESNPTTSSSPPTRPPSAPRSPPATPAGGRSRSPSGTPSKTSAVRTRNLGNAKAPNAPPASHCGCTG